MHIKNKFIKKIFKVAVFIAIFECIYLYALPFSINNFFIDNIVPKLVRNNTNANLEYEKLKIKTHIKPDITFSANKILIKDRADSYIALNSENLKLRISLLDLLRKKINIKEASSKDLYLHSFQDKDGRFNFEELFPSKGNSEFKIKIKNNKIDIDNYNLVFEDKMMNKSFIIKGNPLKAELINRKNIIIKAKGQTINSEKQSDFDIDINTDLPFVKKLNPKMIKGNCSIYNFNLDLIEPFFSKFIDKNTKKMSGNIDYFHIATTKNGNNNIVSINSLFHDIVYDRLDWSNDVHVNGEGRINISAEPYQNKISIKSLQVLADNVDIKAYGSIDVNGEKPYVDLTAKVKQSKAENIFAMLPQNITQALGTIEKVKHYGIYGDVEGEAQIVGNIPCPDIIGYVKAKNVHALDKSIHNLHKGTIDITFDKRKLNMDILVELFGGQSARIDGYTYMYRDGVNNINVKTTNNIDFPLAQKIIIPISKVFNFMLGPIVDMDITSGKGIIDLNIQGNMEFVSINGYSDFRNAALTYNGLHGKFDRGAGRLDFKNDVISFKTRQAFICSNPLSIDGYVKINDHLEYNIKANKADVTDVWEIINHSGLLKDVKAGLAIFTEASGKLNLDTNIKAKIVPVPFGQPPLPPEEAFEDMRVKGNVELLDANCKIIGFKTPIEHVKGSVDYTETQVDINNLTAISGTSSITISGKVLNDLKTKIPDVDIVVKSDSVNLKDTIKFLTESYLYPDFYPNISSLYNIASKHDLYFKYKAKSVDFLTKNAYAVMNFIPDDTDSSIKAKSGSITLDKATVKVDKIIAKLYDNELFINGNVKHVDTVNPKYNLNIQTSNFNLENLNDTSRVKIMPQKMTDIIEQFAEFKGFMDINMKLDNNILKGNVDFKSPEFIHVASKIPFKFDDFSFVFKENKIMFDDVSANIADIPLFGDFLITDYYTKPHFNAFFTSKLSDNFIKTYLKPEISNKITLTGDINFTSKVSGTMDNLQIEPKLTLNPDSDISIENTNIGDSSKKREITGKIKLAGKNIYVDNLDYIKYISSQNNKIYPIKFMTVSGLLKSVENKIVPETIKMKTFKNMPAKYLNVFLKSPILKQGSFDGEITYNVNEETKLPQIAGDMVFVNIDIPLYDTIIKQVKLSTDENDINLSLFGFLFDEKVGVKAKMKNDLSGKPQITALNIHADKIDKDKLFEIMSKTHVAMNTNNQIKNIDLGGLSIVNGHIQVNEFTVKDFSTNNFNTDFSIDDKGIFTANNIYMEIAQGEVKGDIIYDLNNTEITCDLELIDVDSNYVAETLFEAKNQIYGNANGRLYLKTKGLTDEDKVKNLSGFVFVDIDDGKMPKLGSLEYLLRAGNILKSGITGFTINSILELLNLVKTGYFSNINGTCTIENGIAQDIEIYSKGENLSLYIHGDYDIEKTSANMEILGKLSKHISTIFGTMGNISLNTFFKLIPGISMFDFGRKDFIEDVEKIPSFTNGDYDARIFQAIIDGNINSNNYVQSFKWVK